MLKPFSFPLGNGDHIDIKLLAELGQCLLILDGFQGTLALNSALNLRLVCFVIGLVNLGD